MFDIGRYAQGGKFLSQNKYTNRKQTKNQFCPTFSICLSQMCLVILFQDVFNLPIRIFLVSAPKDMFNVYSKGYVQSVYSQDVLVSALKVMHGV